MPIAGTPQALYQKDSPQSATDYMQRMQREFLRHNNFARRPVSLLTRSILLCCVRMSLDIDEASGWKRGSWRTGNHAVVFRIHQQAEDGLEQHSVESMPPPDGSENRSAVPVGSISVLIMRFSNCGHRQHKLLRRTAAPICGNVRPVQTVSCQGIPVQRSRQPRKPT